MNKFTVSLTALAAACALAACSKKAETEAPAADTAAAEATAPDAASAETAAEALGELAAVDPDAPPADGTERFYGREKFTIVSTQSGSQTGEVVEHVRDWGRKRAEISRTTVSFGGHSQSVNSRTVQDGDKIANINLDSGAVMTTDNPMYDTIVAKMKGKSGMEFGKEIMAEMGGRETGEKGSFAGHDCAYWELAAMGAKTCVTSWGGTLQTSVNMGGMTFERTAKEVRMGDGGPDDAFTYDASKVVTMPAGMPDVGKILQNAQETAEVLKGEPQ